MANLFYRDVKYLFEIVITVWMFATSVVYPIGRVGGRLGAVLALNPMTPPDRRLPRGAARPARCRGWRSRSPSPRRSLLLAVAWVTFHRAEFDFAENL